MILDATEGLQIRVVFEDEDLLAVSKPAGLSVHASSIYNSEATLESLLGAQVGRRLILLHRLDKETTGLVLFAKRKPAAGILSRAFEEKRIRKAYLAVVDGVWAKKNTRAETFIYRDADGQLQSSMSLSAEINGKKAVTTFRVLLGAPDRTLLEAIPKTGRTHQIRLHCAGFEHAILGDRRYGRQKTAVFSGQALHAYRMDIQHPMTKVPVSLLDPPPLSWNLSWLTGFDPVEFELWRKGIFI